MFRALPLVCLGLLLSCKGQEGPTKTALDTKEAWCPDGFEAGPDNTCFAIPDSPPKNASIVVYLHPMFEGRGSAEEWSRVREMTEKGFAVVVPRGKRGLCGLTAELQNHFCWPHESEDLASIKPIVKEWNQVLWQVDSILEQGTHARYVFGVGNGATFASYLAESGLFDAAAYAIVGAGADAPKTKTSRTPPILLAVSDTSDQAPKVKELHEGLLKASWPHALCPRAGAEPKVTSEDVELAVRFFRREGDGGLKSSKAGELSCEGEAAAPSSPPRSAPRPKKR